MYQNCNVIKAAAAAARTNVTREIRQELKATDPDRSRGTDVESSSIVDGDLSWDGSSTDMHNRFQLVHTKYDQRLLRFKN